MIKTILVIIPYRGIGDLLFHIPLLKGVCKKYQNKLIILTNKTNKAKNILKNEEYIKKIEYINFQRESLIINSFKLLKRINFYNPDISILTAHSKRLQIPLLLSASKSKIFFKKDLEKDLSKYVLKQSRTELSDINFIKDYKWNYSNKRLSKKNIFISIDSHHDSNNWKQEYYIELVQKILTRQLTNKIFINFAPNKIDNFKKIKNKFKNIKKIFFTYSLDFSKLINIINNSDHIIGNESGPICIGAALNKKVLSIYYPKHTNKSSLTINKKVKFFNSDIINYKVIISKILNIIK